MWGQFKAPKKKPNQTAFPENHGSEDALEQTGTSLPLTRETRILETTQVTFGQFNKQKTTQTADLISERGKAGPSAGTVSLVPLPHKNTQGSQD